MFQFITCENINQFRSNFLLRVFFFFVFNQRRSLPTLKEVGKLISLIRNTVVIFYRRNTIDFYDEHKYLFERNENIIHDIIFTKNRTGRH